MKTHRFRLYPNQETEDKLIKTLNICRNTYNLLLSQFQDHNLTKFENQSILPNIKICDKTFKKVHSKVLQYENYRLYSNLKALTETKAKGRKVGRLRYKGKNWFKTFTYNQTGFKLINSNKRNQTLQLSKIGSIPIRVHRPVEGKIKQITIKKESSGKWFASITAESKKKATFNIVQNVVGIDLGTIDTVYDSDGRVIKNPKFINKYENQIKKKHHQLSRKKKGSNNRLKSRVQLARKYEQLRNARDDFIHKQSHFYTTNYDAIGMEDFNISVMNKGSRYAKSNYDAGWGKLRQYITYKAENAGKLAVLVDYRGTTQLCSNCNNKVPKNIWDREHKCQKCGLELPRDYNSALEIRNRTIKALGQGLSDFKPVEIPLTGDCQTIDNSSYCVKEAGSHNLKSLI